METRDVVGTGDSVGGGWRKVAWPFPDVIWLALHSMSNKHFNFNNDDSFQLTDYFMPTS